VLNAISLCEAVGTIQQWVTDRYQFDRCALLQVGDILLGDISTTNDADANFSHVFTSSFLERP
jgi:hypothetical protein